MKQSLCYICFSLLLLCEVKASKSHQLLNRLKRAVNGTSLNNANQNWHSNKPSNDNWSQFNNQWNNNNSFKPNANNYQPQNTYGYNADRNGYPTRQPGWNLTGQQWNSPNGQYAQGHSNSPSNYPPQNAQGYNSGSNGYPSQPVGWNSGYNPDPNRYYHQPSGYTGISSQWNNSGGNINQGSLYNPNYPAQIGGPPQFNSNSNGYNKPAVWKNTGSQGYNLGNQHYVSPNDLMIHRYKRSIDNRGYNGSRHNTDPDWHSDKRSLWFGSKSPWNNTDRRYYQENSTGVNNASNYDRLHNRYVRSMHHHSRHSNISWYNIDPKWYNITPPAFNGTHWNKPGGHYYHWTENNEGHSHHHHRHHHQHETDSPVSSQPEPPTQYETPPQNLPPHHHGPPPNICNYPTAHLYPYHRKHWHPREGSGYNATYPYVPGTDIGSNSTVVKGTSLGRTDNGPNSNGTTAWVPNINVRVDASVTNKPSVWVPENEGSTNTNVTGKDPWGPEITDMNDFDRGGDTPDP